MHCNQERCNHHPHNKCHQEIHITVTFTLTFTQDFIVCLDTYECDLDAHIKIINII